MVLWPNVYNEVGCIFQDSSQRTKHCECLGKPLQAQTSLPWSEFFSMEPAVFYALWPLQAAWGDTRLRTRAGVLVENLGSCTKLSCVVFLRDTPGRPGQIHPREDGENLPEGSVGNAWECCRNVGQEGSSEHGNNLWNEFNTKAMANSLDIRMPNGINAWKLHREHPLGQTQGI